MLVMVRFWLEPTPTSWQTAASVAADVDADGIFMSTTPTMMPIASVVTSSTRYVIQNRRRSTLLRACLRSSSSLATSAPSSSS